MSFVALPPDIMYIIVENISPDWKTLCQLRLCAKYHLLFIQYFKLKILYMQNIVNPPRCLIKERKYCCNSVCRIYTYGIDDFGYAINHVKICYISNDVDWSNIYKEYFMDMDTIDDTKYLLIRIPNLVHTEVVNRYIPYCNYCTHKYIRSFNNMSF